MRRWMGFLLLAVISIPLSPVRGRTPDDNLHILQPDNIDRLRLDFNASRSKVRLVFMLSPT
jgi:hypothetical protein